FRRKRAACACEACHVRKVRCDATTLGTPCTNCTAFLVDCRMPTRRYKLYTRTRKKPDKESDSQFGEPNKPSQGASSPPQRTRPEYSCSSAVISTRQEDTVTTEYETRGKKERDVNEASTAKIHLPYAPIIDAGRIGYFGESCTLNLQLGDLHNDSDLVHYPSYHDLQRCQARLTGLDTLEMEILRQRGAFLLPPKAICDDLIDSYFRWIHPLMPIINRAQFMAQYRNAEKPPSILLLQAMFSAGARVCNSSGLLDDSGSAFHAALTFYKRAKALYDSNYEDDRVTVVQSLLLMGWCWGGSVNVTKSVLYWTRLAITVAQDSGFHRSVEHPTLEPFEERLRKRIWWTLFTRDRSIAVALGQPTCVNMADSDLGMLTEDDFIEDKCPSEYSPDSIHVQFFLQYIKLYIEVDVVLSGYLTATKKGDHTIDFTYGILVTDNWFKNCPTTWTMQHHNFWSAMLHCNYYTILSFIHRANLDRNSKSQLDDESVRLSRSFLVHAAEMIASIVECLTIHDELRYCPTFIVYSLFSVSIMYVYQMRSTMPSVQQSAKGRLRRFMEGMKELSRVWLVGKVVYQLFSSLLGDEVLNNEASKTLSKRHQTSPKSPTARTQYGTPGDVSVRDFDEIHADVLLGAPHILEDQRILRLRTPGGNTRRMPTSTQREAISAFGIGNRSSSEPLQSLEQIRGTKEPRRTFRSSSLQLEHVHSDEPEVSTVASWAHRHSSMNRDVTHFETHKSVGGSINNNSLPFGELHRRELESNRFLPELHNLPNQRTAFQNRFDGTETNWKGLRNWKMELNKDNEFSLPVDKDDW
ncbi:fungal-specific transcription factor domain-containing protein, partial [Dactylonectria estremocensis]